MRRGGARQEGRADPLVTSLRGSNPQSLASIFFAGDHAPPGGQSILDLSFGWVVENHQGVPRPFRIGDDVVEPQMQNRGACVPPTVGFRLSRAENA